MEKIMEYLKSAYHPIGMAVYGSFANGTNHLNSDFDALLVREEGEISHDHSLICGIELDVFIYPKSLFRHELHLTQNFPCVLSLTQSVPQKTLRSFLQEPLFPCHHTQAVPLL